MPTDARARADRIRRVRNAVGAERELAKALALARRAKCDELAQAKLVGVPVAELSRITGASRWHVNQWIAKAGGPPIGITRGERGEP